MACLVCNEAWGKQNLLVSTKCAVTFVELIDFNNAVKVPFIKECKSIIAARQENEVEEAYQCHHTSQHVTKFGITSQQERILR